MKTNYVDLVEKDLRAWGKRATRRVLQGIQKWGVIFVDYATSGRKRKG